jgi:hypothetical protein
MVVRTGFRLSTPGTQRLDMSRMIVVLVDETQIRQPALQLNRQLVKHI